MTEQQPPELGRYLRARRAVVTPGELGLPEGNGRRRTPGLRREELAALAGVSIDYYIRLERGKETRPSPSVLDALARALRLDAEESSYLREIAAQAARGAAADPRPAPTRSVRPTLLNMLEAIRPCPAYVLGRTNDMLAANPSGLHLMPGWSYTSTKEATRDDAVSVPGYNLFNLGARYTPRGEQGRMTLRLYADNIFNKRYWKDTGASYGDTFIHQGAPATVRLSAHYVF